MIQWNRGYTLVALLMLSLIVVDASPQGEKEEKESNTSPAPKADNGNTEGQRKSR